MNRRAALAIAFVGLNLMACCCGGGGNAARNIPNPNPQPPVAVEQNNPPVQPPPVENKKPSNKPTFLRPVGSDSERWKVSRADFGDKWPLTVESGELQCIKSFGVVFHTGGTTYAVNGSAIDLGYKRIDPIWAPDPEFPGAKKSMAPLIDAGRELCIR